MFNLQEIKELMKLMDESSAHELEIENEGSRLVIRKPNLTQSVLVSPTAHLPVHAATHPHSLSVSHPHQEAVAPAAAGNENQNLHRVISPMVGTFYRSPSPDASPFVSTGDRINEKTVVCIVEAMKLMNEIEAEVKGEIVEILVENGQLVEFGQPLFLVKAD